MLLLLGVYVLLISPHFNAHNGRREDNWKFYLFGYVSRGKDHNATCQDSFRVNFWCQSIFFYFLCRWKTLKVRKHEQTTQKYFIQVSIFYSPLIKKIGWQQNSYEYDMIPLVKEFRAMNRGNLLYKNQMIIQIWLESSKIMVAIKERHFH